MFFYERIKSATLSQNHRRSQGGGTGGLRPLNRNATNDKNLTKNLVSSFPVSFSIFAFNSTGVRQ